MTVTRCRSPTAGPRGALSGYRAAAPEARSCSRTRHCGGGAPCRRHAASQGRRRSCGCRYRRSVHTHRACSPMASSFRRPARPDRSAARRDPATGHRTSSSATLKRRDRARPVRQMEFHRSLIRLPWVEATQRQGRCTRLHIMRPVRRGARHNEERQWRPVYSLHRSTKRAQTARPRDFQPPL